MTRDAFIEKYASIYEHSPWVAEAAFGAADIQAAMRDVVDGAGRDAQLQLIRNHPDLACAPATKLTEASVSEQKGAGLNECSVEEYAEFQQLNADYKAKFGFPFIVAVKGLTRMDILVQFRARLQNDTDVEFATALAQIHKIAGFRLSAIHA